MPDGIATEDWDRVHELAVQVVNDSAEGDVAASDAAALRLRELLDELQEKYGALPSILATRADYVASQDEREYWLLAAYEQAQQRKDAKNLAWIASSLACFHLEEAPDLAKGTQWVESFEQHLQGFSEPSERIEAVRLRGILQSLKEAAANNEVQRTRPARMEPRS